MLYPQKYQNQIPRKTNNSIYYSTEHYKFIVLYCIVKSILVRENQTKKKYGKLHSVAYNKNSYTYIIITIEIYKT